MMKRIPLLGVAVLFLTMTAQPVLAGGNLVTVDISAGTQTLPPFVDGTLVPIKWDPRCIPVQFTFFDDGIGEPAGAGAEIVASMNSWNQIPTSFIELSLAKTVAAPGNPFGAFDMVNEINFDATGGFLAAAPSVSLIADTNLTPGTNLDGDGDADVFDPVLAGINVCTDIDNDGDIDFPAGLYPAGTILDNDVFFVGAFPWVTAPSPTGIDIQSVAVHELGHSHGLSHTLLNQLQTDNDCDSDGDSDDDSDGDSDDDSDGDSDGGAVVAAGIPGSGSTMFPFIDTGDPAAETSQRSLSQDDVSWSSFSYPEGTASTGPAALQSGDIAFDDVFGVVSGEVLSGAQGGLPLAGASVQVCDTESGNIVGEGFSGTVQLLVVPGALAPSNEDVGLACCIGQGFHILDGKYQIPVPEGDYKVFTEALDGFPASAGNIGLVAVVGNIFGQLDFEEEFWRRGSKESAFEAKPGKGDEVEVEEGETTSGIDITTNVTAKLAGSGDIEVIAFTNGGGFQFAVRFPGADVQALLAGDAVLHTGLFFTDVVDHSEVPTFAKATLAGGSVDGTTGNLVIDQVLSTDEVFVGQDEDSTPFFFKGPKGLSNQVRDDLANGAYDDLVLLLEVPPGPFSGVSGAAPLVGVDLDPPFGNSFLSTDGGASFPPVSFNFVFDLVATP